MNRGTIVALLVACAGLLGESAAFAQQPPPPQPPAPAPPAKPPPAQKPPAKPPTPAPKPPPAAAPKPAAPPAAAPKPAAPPPKPAAPPAKAPAKPNGAEDQPDDAGEKPPAEPPAEGTEPEEDGTEPGGPPETQPAPTPQPGTRPAGPGAGGLTPMPMWPQPGSDAAALEKQGDQRPAKDDAKKTDGDRVFAEDWWSHARPIFEIHGYFRLRAELFHNFSLGRIDPANRALWPMPIDNHFDYLDASELGPELCTGDESAEGRTESDDPNAGLFPCKNKTQAGANIRFRLNPELHISDNLRVMSQIDMLDNLVLGSTPEGYSNEPGVQGGYQATVRGGYAPLGAFETTQAAPSAGINSYRDSIRVKRAWAEYMTPVGQLRFGRMPSHWGLGILANSGDGYDDDYQSTADRIMFVTGIKAIDLYFAGAWDFSNEGATSDTLALPGAQPYDLGQLDDVDQYVLAISRRKNPELTKLALAQGDLVLNGGVYVVYRKQLLANDRPGPCADTNSAQTLGCSSDQYASGFVRRGAEAWIPDLWLQVLYKKFRFELEAVTIQGSVENTLNQNSNFTSAPGGAGWSVEQWGIATELSQKLVEDRLKLEFKFGWASGDEDVYGPNTGSGGLVPGINGLQTQLEDDTISTFRFHPNYKVDLILNRNLLTRIQGVHYFRPSVEYDFIRNTNGQRFGGGFAAIWTRATRFIQTPGHNRELGVELDFSLYFQSKDGALNDDPDKMGGFYTMLQYGVLFPLAGLDYQQGEVQNIVEEYGAGSAETSTAQILRWYLGVMF